MALGELLKYSAWFVTFLGRFFEFQTHSGKSDVSRTGDTFQADETRIPVRYFEGPLLTILKVR